MTENESPRQRRRANDEAIDELNRRVTDYCSEAKADRREASEHRRLMRLEISCLATGFKEFKAEWDKVYKPHLDESITTEKEHDEFVKSKIKSWKSIAADAVVVWLLAIVVYATAASDVIHKLWAKAKNIL